MKQTEQSKAMTIRHIPAETFRRFKTACAAEGKSMREVVIELMETYSKKGKKGVGLRDSGRISPSQPDEDLLQLNEDEFRLEGDFPEKRKVGE